MSYKRIGTLIHNWSHQFISLMNYVDGDYVFDEMMRLLSRRESGGNCSQSSGSHHCSGIRSNTETREVPSGINSEWLRTT